MKLLIFLTVLLTTLITSISGQTSSKDLARQDIVLNKNKPTIYLCIDTKVKTESKDLSSDFIWLQLHNNTIWALSFHSEQGGNSKLYKFPDGRTVPALEDKAVSTPQYEIENTKLVDDSDFMDSGKNKTERSTDNEPIIKWGDTAATSWLLSGNSTTFKIPKNYFSEGRLILVEYKYQWEMIGTGGYESYSPNHRVAIWFDLNDSKANSCVP